MLPSIDDAGCKATARGQDMDQDITGQAGSPTVEARPEAPCDPAGEDGVLKAPETAQAVVIEQATQGPAPSAEGSDGLDGQEAEDGPLASFNERPDYARHLEPMQWAFCVQWWTDLSPKDAALRAGYSSKTAQAQGGRLVRNPRVARVLTEMMPSQLGLSRPMILQAFMKIAGSRSATHSDQIAALDKLAKAIGLYREAPAQATQINVHIYPGEADL